MGRVHWFHSFGEIAKWGVLEWVCENRQLPWSQTWNPVFLFNTEVASMNPLPHMEQNTHCEECSWAVLSKWHPWPCSALILTSVSGTQISTVLRLRTVGNYFWQTSGILEVWLTVELRLKELVKIKDSVGTIMFQANIRGSDLWPVLPWLQFNRLADGLGQAIPTLWRALYTY